MNRLHRLGGALLAVGGTGAGICFVALMYALAIPNLFWPVLIATAGCGVTAGIGYVIRETFNDPPSESPLAGDDSPDDQSDVLST